MPSLSRSATGQPFFFGSSLAGPFFSGHASTESGMPSLSPSGAGQPFSLPSASSSSYGGNPLAAAAALAASQAVWLKLMTMPDSVDWSTQGADAFCWSATACAEAELR